MCGWEHTKTTRTKSKYLQGVIIVGCRGQKVEKMMDTAAGFYFWPRTKRICCAGSPGSNPRYNHDNETLN
jgi:hypothetical protein